MPNPIYRYNAHTCKYERSRLTVGAVLRHVFGVTLTACLMLAGALALHDFLVESEKEVAFQKENSALEKNHIILTKKVADVESTLLTLHARDQKLHNKFFHDQTSMSAGPSATGTPIQILSGDVADFKNELDILYNRSNELIRKSVETNEYFANQTTIPEGFAVLKSIPTLQPVKALSPQAILSGFGLRINPFHKGLYNHPGIDIAAPRGTRVIATASGKIIEVKKSELEAGYGNYIDIDHGYGFITRYAHLEDIFVKEGHTVEKGAEIATIGNTGGSVAPHLHYEVIRAGKNADPINYMFEGWSSEQHVEFKSISQLQNQSLD